MWQDYVFSIGAVFFSVALIPTLLSKDKPPFLTTVPTALILFVFSATFGTLHMWFTMATQGLAAFLWSTIALQKYLQNRD